MRSGRKLDSEENSKEIGENYDIILSDMDGRRLHERLHPNRIHDLTQAPRTKHCSSWSSGSQNSISQADGNPKCVEELLNPDDNTLFGRKFKSDLRKKARQCQNIFLEVHQISSRNSTLSQVPREHERWG